MRTFRFSFWVGLVTGVVLAALWDQDQRWGEEAFDEGEFANDDMPMEVEHPSPPVTLPDEKDEVA